MKKESIREIVEYDGMLWYRYPESNNSNSKNYFQRNINYKKVRLHRYKYEKEIGPIPDGHHVDHINGCSIDNNIDNLQILSPTDHGRKHQLGKPKTIETKQKMSASAQGKHNWGSKENHPMFGRQHSEETRLKMSISAQGKYIGENNPMFGKTQSDECKSKISIANSGINSAWHGKQHTIETKQKMSESALNRWSKIKRLS